ncbi:CAAX amino terminal protease self- immunity [Rhodococcus sp. PML026]|nr:CAAX amino terminal protease self- immunity [Rhodococcus sp. PML026]
MCTPIAGKLTPVPRTATFERPVSGGDALLSIGSLLIGAIAVVAAVVLLVGVFDLNWVLGYAIPLATAVFAVALWQSLSRRGWTWKDLQLTSGPRSLWHLLWEVPVAWIAAMSVGIALAGAVGIAPASDAGGSASTLDALDVGVVAGTLTIACTVLIAPVLEEVLFRRVIFGWFDTRTRWQIAVLGSAVCFGAVHVLPAIALIMVCIGSAAALLVRLHRSLIPGIALHTMNNAVATAAVVAAI